MTQAIDHALREITALRAQRDALASVVVIAWARARDENARDSNACVVYADEGYGMQAQMLAAGLIEETEAEAGDDPETGDTRHRLTAFGRQAMQGSAGAEGLDGRFDMK
jgi:hypothetical protein